MQTGNLPSGLPEDHGFQTLGWVCLAWVSKHLHQPDGPDAGGPFRFTPEQARFCLWLYAIDSKTGRWVYSMAVLRRMKGWGKGPMTAALCLFELLGPCRFAGWKRDGTPRARRHPKAWVQIAAVSEKQTANTFSMIRAMIGSRTEIDGRPVDCGMTRIYAGENNEHKLEPVTTRSESLEGNQISFVVIDEPHHLMETNGGHALVKVCKRNASKARELAAGAGSTARVMMTTNAHEPGRGSAAEAEWDALLKWRAGLSPRYNTLYDCLEAPAYEPGWTEEGLAAALRVAIGDSTWLDVERLITDFYDATVPIEDSMRFYLNQLAASADRWVTPQAVDKACNTDAPLPERGALIALAFDGSLTDDASALVGCELHTGLVFVIKVWEKPDGPEGRTWEMPRDEAHDMVAWAHEYYDVCAFFSDVHPFESYVDLWANTWREQYVVKAGPKHSVGFDMRSRGQDFTKGAESFQAALMDGSLAITAMEPRYLEAVKRHLNNARRRPNQWGVSFAKEGRESPRKIDSAVCAVLVRIARRAAIEAGALTKRRKRSGKAWGFDG